MQIEIDDLIDGKVEHLLAQHLEQMHEYSPAENVHALDKQKMADDKITFWSARTGESIMGCGALKRIGTSCAELKSMKTAPEFLRQGVAEALLTEILQQAKSQGFDTVFLETGRHSAFDPAVKLYVKHGFVKCGKFADYEDNPYSRFFVKTLD